MNSVIAGSRISVTFCLVRLLPLLAAVALGMIAAHWAASTRQGAPPAADDLQRQLREPGSGAALDAIAAEDADIVLLQEVTTEWQRALADAVREAVPDSGLSHSLARRRWARGAVEAADQDRGDAALPRARLVPAERLVVETAFGALQILNVHLRPAIDGGSWFKGFMTTPPLRRREIETYWRRLARDLPTIIAGDFNEDPKRQRDRVPVAPGPRARADQPARRRGTTSTRRRQDERPAQAWTSTT